MAKIEFREFVVRAQLGFDIAVHQFLVKYDDDGTTEELYGIAVDREDHKLNLSAFDQGYTLKAATTKNNDILKVAAYPPSEDYPFLNIQGFKTFYSEKQNSYELFRGSESEVNMRWKAAKLAAEEININGKWNYKVVGLGCDGLNYANSNSVTATLESIMGFTAINISSRLPVPGLEKNLLPKSNYPNLYNLEWGVGGQYNPSFFDSVCEMGAEALARIVGGSYSFINDWS